MLAVLSIAMAIFFPTLAFSKQRFSERIRSVLTQVNGKNRRVEPK
jgi:hypothetical protein